MIEKPLPHLQDLGVLFQNPVHLIRYVSADFGDFKRTYFVNDTGIRVGIVGILDERVLLVEQYRLLTNSYSLEIPGGSVDSPESPREAAIREFREETGYNCLDVKQIAFYYPGLDTANNPTHIFLSHQIELDLTDEINRHPNEGSTRK